jgi:ubiquinone/menaquinone biosynthesis C-methylase UbiE
MNRNLIADILCPICKGRLFPDMPTIRCEKCNMSFQAEGNIIFLDDDALDLGGNAKNEIYSNRFSRDFLYKESKDLDNRVASYHNFFHTDKECKSAVEEMIESKAAGKKLDIGCGLGIPLYPIGPNICENDNIIGLDLSIALLKEADQKNRLNNLLILANAQSLPFLDSSFDLVLGRHMLYHVSDINAVCKEAHRVLKKNGFFVATTNSINGKKELFQLHEDALKEVSGETVSISRGTARFSLENGKQILQNRFANIRTFKWNGFFRFPTVEDFMAYYTSTPYYKKASKDKEVLESISQSVFKTVKNVIEKEGGFLLKNEGGVFVCSK